MQTALAKFATSGLGKSTLAAIISLGVAVSGPATAWSADLDRPATYAATTGVIDVPDTTSGEALTGIVDHVFEFGPSDKFEIKAAVETFIWGLSNRQSGAVWLIAPETEQAKFGSKEGVYAFFSQVHPPLVQAKSIAFDSITAAGANPVATIYVTDIAGLQWRASFAMMRDSAGSWKIAGCRLLPAPGNLV